MMEWPCDECGEVRSHAVGCYLRTSDPGVRPPNSPGSEGTEVTKYDRALLERTEVQPVTTQDGHTIVVNTLGRFEAKVGDVSISEYTLDKAEEKVHATHMALERNRRKKTMAVQCFVYDAGQYRYEYIGPAFFRGVHAGNGDLLYARPDGTKGRQDKLVVFPVKGGGESVERLRGLADEEVALRARLKEIRAAVDPILKEQQKKMYDGDTFYLGYGSVRVHNDATRAQEVAERIVANVLRTEE